MALTEERLKEALSRLPTEMSGRSPPGKALASTRSIATSGPGVDAPDVTWTQHWPFPRFLPKDHDERHLDADSDDSDTPTAPPKVAAVHHLSCDSVLAESHGLGGQSPAPWSRSGTATPGAHATGLKSRGHVSAANADGAVRRRPTSAAPTNTGGNSVRGRRPGSAVSSVARGLRTDHEQSVAVRGVLKEEITALASVFDPSNPLGGRVDMAHMDLGWIVRKRRAKAVAPPAVHLHLGNLAASLQSVAKEREVLINSPRSAIVLLRNGVTIKDLKKQPPSLSCAVIEEKPFVTLEQLTWEQKKYLALETARVAKLREIVSEYRRVCDEVSFDDVVAFCSAYNPERPSTAMLIPFATDPPPNPSERQHRAPEDQCSMRLNTLVDKFQRRADRINRSADRLTNTHDVERDRTVERLVRAEHRGEMAHKARLEHVRSMGVASRGRSELWRTQRNRHERVETFRRMVTREGLQRRLDEVACVQTGMQRALDDFQDTVRKQNLHEAMAKESQTTAAIQRAKVLFRETKK